MEELYENLYGNNVTIISNEFLSKFLSDTKSQYIKVFLFYVWKGFKENYSIEEASSEIDLPEDEIEMALKFWVRKKIFKKEYLDNINSKKNTKSINENKSDKLVDFETKKKELINKNRKDYAEIEPNLLFFAEKMLGKTLSERQVNLIAKCYNEYGFEESVIQYLFEYCYKESKTDARYMMKVAESWYEQNVKTVKEAEDLVNQFDKGIVKKTNKKDSANKQSMNRDEYNEWFKKNILSNKKNW